MAYMSGVGLMYNELTASEIQLFELAKPYLFVMHNEMHTREVIRFALNLLNLSGGDRGIVIPSVILHDVGWSQVPEAQAIKMRIPEGDPEFIKIHENHGAKIARIILEQVSEDIFKTNEIVEIIQGHDTRKRALSKNDEIVKDSDKLSRYARPGFLASPQRLNGKDSWAIYDGLERGLKKWFFLPHSRKIAERELQHRRQEIGSKQVDVKYLTNKE